MKLILSTLLVIAVIFSSCNEKKGNKTCCKTDDSKSCKTNTVMSDESVYNLESKWVKQNNDTISLIKLSDKITVAAMVFTHCEAACPRIIADMQRIEKAFTVNDLQKIRFLLISMDPARDTPERFREFSKEHQLNTNWICISSSDDATMEIANVLNVRIKKLSNGGYDHSNTIFLLNKNGNVVFQQNGLAQEPTEMIQQIKSILN